MMTPFPGTVDFARWEKEQARKPTLVGNVPITRYWLIPTETRPKMFTPHPSMSSEEIGERTQKAWDRFYNWSAIWQRSACAPRLRSRIAFVFLSKLYRQMYAGTGISTDSAPSHLPCHVVIFSVRFASAQKCAKFIVNEL